ncbi:MAG: START-like domain-containing protein [Microscillaceae bacterium]|nr:START-like domain-containing protein [Microscillaceae bacterium]
MTKYKYVEEFEISASPKTIYNYLYSPTNLSEWFANDVKVDRNKVFNFIWDEENHFARLVIARANKQVRFEFLDENKEKTEDPEFVEFRLQESELTNSTFLKVTDYSEIESEKDLKDLWEGLITHLREVVGGQIAS